MVLDASLLNTQHYKVRIKGKVEQSKKEVAPSPTPWCSSYRKGSLRDTHDYGRQLFLCVCGGDSNLGYRKQITNSYNLLGLKIVQNNYFNITNFLHLTQHLEKRTFEPFKKENDTPIYMYTSSNQSPSSSNRYQTDSRRLSDNSSTVDIFDSKNHMQQGTKKSGHT